jgi:hypothetical protein
MTGVTAPNPMPRGTAVATSTPRIANVPLDLLRHELLMTLQPVPEQTISEIVDEIFPPLVRKRP